MNSKFLYLFFLSICLASCESHPSYWVTHDQLQPSTNPSIKTVKLVNGSIIIFNQNLGYYDSNKQIIEGITITGWHDTTTLAKVESVEIQDEESNNVSNALKVIGITLLAGGIVLGIAMLNYSANHGGQACLVTIAVVGIATTGAALLIFA
jgi:hypothetical protein